jgi:hypothetical protein
MKWKCERVERKWTMQRCCRDDGMEWTMEYGIWIVGA